MSNRLPTVEELQTFTPVEVEISKETYDKILKLKKDSDPRFYKEIYAIAEQSEYDPAWYGCIERNVCICEDKYFATWKIRDLSKYWNEKK
jgi:hypothetical protein